MLFASGSIDLDYSALDVQGVLKEIPAGYFVTIRLSTDQEHSLTSIIRGGANLIDTELTFRRAMTPGRAMKASEPHDIQFVKTISGGEFIELAAEMKLSRFFKDSRFGENNALKLWKASIRSHCSGYADELVISNVNGERAGFVALQFENAKQVRLHIVGVLKQFQGKGLGNSMLTEIIIKKGNSHNIIVETQAVNSKAQRTYKSAGFTFDSLRYILHHWR